MSNENYAVKDLSLLSAPAVPADADILLIMAPKSDLSTQDGDKIRAYLAQGEYARAKIEFETVLQQLQASGAQNVLLVSSGGPISCAVSHVLAGAWPTLGIAAGVFSHEHGPLVHAESLDNPAIMPQQNFTLLGE